jgi:hypothetical protein
MDRIMLPLFLAHYETEDRDAAFTIDRRNGRSRRTASRGLVECLCGYDLGAIVAELGSSTGRWLGAFTGPPDPRHRYHRDVVGVHPRHLRVALRARLLSAGRRPWRFPTYV